MEKRIIPKFASEAEEADWWFDNRELLADQFEQAAKEGRLGRGTAMQRLGIPPPTMIRLEPNDMTRAKSIAEKKGLPYQAYLESVIHEALDREERQAS